MSFDWEEFFKKQIEENGEHRKLADNTEDRAFWQQAAERWEEQHRRAQQAQQRNRQHAYRRKALS